MTQLLTLSLSFLVGLVLGHYFDLGPAFTLLAPAGIGVVAFATRRFTTNHPLALIPLVTLLGWSHGGVGASVGPGTKAATVSPCLRVIYGRAATSPMPIDSGWKFALETNAIGRCLDSSTRSPSDDRHLQLTVTSPGEASPRVSRGDRVAILAAIRPFRPSANRPGGPAQARIYWTARLKSAQHLVVTAEARWSILQQFDTARRHIAALLMETLPRDSAALARALALGDTGALSSAQKRLFRQTGTSHLLSVSGLHLGIVCVIFFVGFRLLLLRTPLAHRTDVGRPAAAIALTTTIAFTLLTGCKIPVVRACILAGSVLLARILGRQSHAPGALALAAVVILLHTPCAIFEPGFQLSFSAVIAFFVLLRSKQHRDNDKTNFSDEDAPTRAASRLRKLARYTSELTRTTIAAWAVTTPIALYHFGTLSHIAVLANLPAVVWTSFLLMPLLLILTLLLPFGAFLTLPLGVAAHGALRALTWWLEQASALQNTLLDYLYIPAIAVLGVCAGCALWLLHRRRLALAITGIWCACSMFAGLATPQQPVAGKLVIDFLDMGQANATLITFPGGTRWLVDTGEYPTHRSSAASQIPTILKSLGVHELNTLVLTHPHPDHVGGTENLLDELPVEDIWDNGQNRGEEILPALTKRLESARKTGVRILGPQDFCQPRRVDGVSVETLHPCYRHDSYEPTLSVNDNSIVLRLLYGATSVLLTGDIEAEAERALLHRGVVRPVDLLALGHHGSRTSSSEDFLDQLRPSVAVASMGLSNRFGFPSPAVRRRLQERGIVLYRTDLHGRVRAISDGRVLKIVPSIQRAIDGQ